ncbi:MAG TPA: hypothetical protein VF676_06075 [Flavobacterium sp.]|jgi:hypothetical protein
MIIIVSRYLIPKGYRGITLCPFVLVREKSDVSDPVMLNHERIHIRQQVELLVFPFFIWYGTEYLLRLLIYWDAKKAYRNICFEREAYQNEKDLNYLKKRSFWRFLEYFRRT